MSMAGLRSSGRTSSFKMRSPGALHVHCSDNGQTKATQCCIWPEVAHVSGAQLTALPWAPVRFPAAATLPPAKPAAQIDVSGVWPPPAGRTCLTGACRCAETPLRRCNHVPTSLHLSHAACSTANHLRQCVNNLPLLCSRSSSKQAHSDVVHAHFVPQVVMHASVDMHLCKHHEFGVSTVHSVASQRQPFSC
jgi:hypothetical protein